MALDCEGGVFRVKSIVFLEGIKLIVLDFAAMKGRTASLCTCDDEITIYMYGKANPV